MAKSSQTQQKKTQAKPTVSIQETIMVPLGQLVSDPDNVRNTNHIKSSYASPVPRAKTSYASILCGEVLPSFDSDA